MAERDKVIKTGQLTLPRLFFLVVVGGVVVFTVYQGGIFLAIGYWLLTLAICGVLFLIAIDYGVKMEKVELHPTQTISPMSSSIAAPAEEVRAATTPAPRPKRKGSRPAKRRR